MQVTRVAVEPTAILNRLSDTIVRAEDFTIALPGRWQRIETPDQLQFQSEAEQRQLIILKYAVGTLSDHGQLRRIFQTIAESKVKNLAQISNNNARVLATNVTESGGHIKARFEAHDPVQLVAIAGAMHGTAAGIISFIIFENGLPKPDNDRRAATQSILDSIVIPQT